LGDDAGASGAYGAAHADFALPGGTAREQHIGQIDTGDQQHEKRGDE
jgi:hypothetical protein